MPRTSLSLRVFVGLLLAVLPPILVLTAALLLSETVFPSTDPNVVAALVLVAVVVWAVILAIAYTRVLSEDVRMLVTLARRGDPNEVEGAEGPYDELATALDERNRQVAQLARQSGLLQIDTDPTRVAEGVVSTAHSILGDPTWRLAVLAIEDPELLPPGVYGAGGGETSPIGELDQWASVTQPDLPARHVEGPWGAFTVIDASAGDRLRAVLHAPWAGRPAPSPADLALLRLVGQHAATAIEHSLLYAKVRSQADELNRLAAIQADFLRGVTHDLQTPLTSIGALATELRVNKDVPDEARADLDTITHQADRLRRMVGQLLVASRLEAGGLTPQQDVFAVTPLVERTWEALRADRPFSFSVEGAPHLAIGDPDRLEQVLWALLDNAVKYSSPGSPIEVVIAPDGNELAVAVRDHGMGMDADTRERAFEQFYRSDQARRMAPDGSGVGLYAARGLVEAMGGSFAVESALGQGTVMTVRLPAEPAGSTD